MTRVRIDSHTIEGKVEAPLLIRLTTLSVADPGFIMDGVEVGEGVGANLLFWPIVFSKNCMKMKKNGSNPKSPTDKKDFQSPARDHSLKVLSKHH